MPASDEILRLFKVSRRRDLDISTFTAAIRMHLDGETISQAAIAFGAVGPTVLRLAKTEQFLVGRPLHRGNHGRGRRDWRLPKLRRSVMSEAAKITAYQLARNVLLKFYLEQQLATA